MLALSLAARDRQFVTSLHAVRPGIVHRSHVSWTVNTFSVVLCSLLTFIPRIITLLKPPVSPSLRNWNYNVAP